MYHAFLNICRQIAREFSIVPLLYGSLGLEKRTGIDLHADDIDILIPTKMVCGEQWLDFRLFLEKSGYVLIDAHEHIFEKEGVHYSFACIEELESFAGIAVKDIERVSDGDACYLLLNLEQYLAVYTRSAEDGYRINKKEKRDHEKIALIKRLLQKQ